MVDVEMLISTIHERPPLWDPSQQARGIVAEKLWNEVAMKCNTSGDVVKKKWKHLKDTFRMVTKKKRSCRTKISWKWYGSLLFLKSPLQRRTRSKKESKSVKDVHLRTVPQVDSTETNPVVSFTPTATVSTVPTCRCNAEAAYANNQCKEPEQFVNVGVQTQGDSHECTSTYSPRPTDSISPVHCKCNVSRANSNKPFEEVLTIQERSKLELIRALSKQEEACDTTYHFLMSLKDPINSMTVYEQMFVRLKFLEIVTHIIQNHCDRQRTPSPS